jgi:hypothetical protein
VLGPSTGIGTCEAPTGCKPIILYLEAMPLKQYIDLSMEGDCATSFASSEEMFVCYLGRDLLALASKSTNCIEIVDCTRITSSLVCGL